MTSVKDRPGFHSLIDSVLFLLVSSAAIMEACRSSFRLAKAAVTSRSFRFDVSHQAACTKAVRKMVTSQYSQCNRATIRPPGGAWKLKKDVLKKVYGDCQ